MEEVVEDDATVAEREGILKLRERALRVAERLSYDDAGLGGEPPPLGLVPARGGTPDDPHAGAVTHAGLVPIRGRIPPAAERDRGEQNDVRGSPHAGWCSPYIVVHH